MTKIYQATIRLTLSVMVEGKRVYVTFSEEKNTYCTTNPKIQAALEATGEFGKKFKLKSVIGAPGKESAPKDKTGAEDKTPSSTDTQGAGEAVATGGDETDKGQGSATEDRPEVPLSGDTGKTHPEVTDIQAAKEVLRKTYSAHHFSLNTPGNILKKAEELGVSFPNLK